MSIEVLPGITELPEGITVTLDRMGSVYTLVSSPMTLSRSLVGLSREEAIKQCHGAVEIMKNALKTTS